MRTSANEESSTVAENNPLTWWRDAKIHRSKDVLWRVKCTASSAVEGKIGAGARQLSAESKDGKQRR